MDLEARVDRLDGRVTEVAESCRSCREQVLDKIGEPVTRVEVLAAQHATVQRVVYALVGSILLAVLTAGMRLILR